ncbi:hypothetical protein GCM10027447_10150 [Glycomyces halotolerans]
MRDAEHQYRQQMAQDLGPDVRRQPLLGPELPLEPARGHPQERVVLALRSAQHRGVGIRGADADGGVGVEERRLEPEQRPFGAFEIAPLLHLAGPRPQPRSRFEQVGGEVHGVPQRPRGERQQMVQARAHRPGRCPRRSVAEPGEREHLDPGGKVAGGGE